MYAQLVNYVQMSSKDVNGVVRALTEEINAYPDMNPSTIFHRDMERGVRANGEILDVWSKHLLPVLLSKKLATAPVGAV